MESTVSGELMDPVILPWIYQLQWSQYAFSVLRELSGAQLLTDVFLFVDKTQPTLWLQMPVYALVDLTWWEIFARFAQPTTLPPIGLKQLLTVFAKTVDKMNSYQTVDAFEGYFRLQSRTNHSCN